MAASVIFFTPRGIGSLAAPGIGDVRVRESVTVPGTTAATLAEGEVALVFNGDGAAILVAHGTNPDAAATAASAVTSAGIPVASATMSLAIVAKEDAKINIKVLA